MVVWPALARALCARYGVRAPIVQAPMADAVDWRVAAGAARAGVLGSIPCATLAPDAIAPAAQNFRETAPEGAPLHLNFFTTHDAAAPTAARQERWMKELAPYYKETGATPPSNAELVATNGRASFDEAACAAVEAARPDIVSFHFGLPEGALLDRVRATGASVWCTATTVAEAKALSGRVDVIIAQGAEAGGHRGSFLGDDCYIKPPLIGTMALVPQVVDAVSEPVVAAGGIGDGRGVVAALALGASGVSVGTAFLRAEDALINDGHRAALESSGVTAVTNVFSGRPARGFENRLVRELGPLSAVVPEFPWASTAVKPLAAADPESLHGSRWAGQAAAIASPRGDGEAVAEWLVADAERVLGELL